ncbi:acid protease, partial [Amniculicola lignicola CBS 123094]
ALPPPVVVAPDQDWEGIDGSWNTFTLRVGEPAQYVHVFISTASQQTWVIDDEACMKGPVDPATGRMVNKTMDTKCYRSRGITFNYTATTTWNQIGFYELGLEQNLNLTGNGRYGYETVGFGHPGEMGPTLKNTTVGTLIEPHFWLGHFGVNGKSTNFTTFADPSPSYMSYLFQDKLIPSLSFAYTAGAQYHLNAVLGSLTLGGYDASRFIPNDLTFEFSPDNERDIVVGVVDILGKTTTRSNINLLTRDGFTMYIDSTVAELWLPHEVCDAFEEHFGLKYDNQTDLYLVDDELHQQLIAENASITFSFGQKFATNATVDIVLPYAAMDLEASPPYRGLNNTSKYYPIRRAENEEQYVLGRTFLQEAYLIVDWERQNFSISQCSWVFGQEKDIVPIISPNYITKKPSKGSPRPKRISTGAIIGIALGGGFCFAMVLFGIAFMIWRRRQNAKKQMIAAQYAAKATTAKESAEKREAEPPTSPTKDLDEGTKVFPKAELPGESISRPGALRDVKEADPTSPSSPGMSSPAIEVDNTERQVFEMPGDFPATQEAGGRELSEKETMMVREQRINGTDPNQQPLITPTTEEPPRRLAPVSPSEVTMVNRRIPAASTNTVSPNSTSVSPTTPRTPMDGALLEANDTFFQPSRMARDGRFLETDDTLLSPISPLDGSTDSTRRRFSYE